MAAPTKLNRRAELARLAGCKVTRGGDVTIGATVYPSWDIDFRSNAQIIELLNVWAHDDAQHDQAIARIANNFRAWASSLNAAGAPAFAELALAKKVHKFVRDVIRFQPEEVEAHRVSSLTLALGAGDCDDQSVFLAALAEACGLPARVEGIKIRGEIAHACSRIRVASRWEWAETTVPAIFGEHPLAAARRLGLKQRTDLTG